MKPFISDYAKMSKHILVVKEKDKFLAQMEKIALVMLETSETEIRGHLLIIININLMEFRLISHKETHILQMMNLNKNYNKKTVMKIMKDIKLYLKSTVTKESMIFKL